MLPHLQHSVPQLRRELFVRFFRSRGCERWINRIADSYPQWGKFLKFLSARPSFIKTFNRHRNNWRLDVNRKDRRTFLETATTAAAATLLTSRLSWAAAEHKIEKVGVQLYTVRDQMKSDFDVTIAKTD